MLGIARRRASDAEHVLGAAMAAGKPSGSSGAGGIRPEAEREADPPAPAPVDLRRAAALAARSREVQRELRERYKSSLLGQGRNIFALFTDDAYYGYLGDAEAGSAGLVQSRISGRKSDQYYENVKVNFGLAMRGLRSAEVTVWADVVEVKVMSTIDDRRGGGPRGAVFGMSKGSRRRMMQRMAKVRDLEKAWFITLTYPDVFPEDWEVWKQHLKAWIKRLKRAAEKWGVTVAGIWRLELVIRKSGEVNMGRPAPHFHIVLMGLDSDVDITAFREWLSRSWFEVVGSGDPAHLKAGTQCRKVEDRAHAMRYVSKYVAKADEQVAALFALKMLQTGRVWGQFGELDTSPSLHCYFPATGMPALRRMVAGWLQARGRGYYAKRVKRDVMGFFVLGLGDSSQGLSSAGPGGEMATIERMIDFAFDMAFEYERKLRRLEGECHVGQQVS